jgi:hypothetical protein
MTNQPEREYPGPGDDLTFPRLDIQRVFCRDRSCGVDGSLLAAVDDLLSADAFGARRLCLSSRTILRSRSSTTPRCRATRAIHTGVVVDFGTSCVRIVPLLEGHPMRPLIHVHSMGKFRLGDTLGRPMTENGEEGPNPPRPEAD